MKGIRQISANLQLLALFVVAPGIVFGQQLVDARFFDAPPSDAPGLLIDSDLAPVLTASTKLDSTLQSFGGLSADELRRLMWPTFDFSAEWYAKVDQIEMATFGGKVKIPLYPIFGPPPPFLSAGFSYTDIDAPSGLDLPDSLYETSLGLSWMRRLNDRWMFQSLLGVANATDGNNNSSDAWQFRGGVFAIYRPSPRWTWTFGALALGRNDIPVVPAVGLICQPNESVRFDLTFPRPRANFLLADNGSRQQWVYVGAGFSGGTWAYERNDGIDDQITYRDWKLALGWESTPRRKQGIPFVIGRKLGAEVGYAFAQQFEFERVPAKIEVGETVFLRATASF